MSDLISRQAAIDDFYHIKCNLQMMDDTHTADKMMHGLYLAENAVKLLPSAQRTGRWIPLCDKWPDKYGNYLVCTSRGCVVTDYYASYGWDDDSDKDYVVAWMPLPEPYKEEQE